MRFSDLKKNKTPAAPAPVAAPPPPIAPARPSPPPAAPARPPERPPERAPVAWTKAPLAPAPAPARDDASDRSAARAAYGRAIEAVRVALAAVDSAGSVAAAAAASRELAELAASGNSALLALTQYGTPDEPTAAHSVNVAILSGLLAHELGSSASDIQTLALAGLLHDLGRARPYRLALKTVAAPEAQAIRRSLVGLAARLADNPDLPAAEIAPAARVISQLHAERVGGVEAQILSLCDVYDALTHGYDGKPGLNPGAAFKALNSVAGGWERSCIKAFLQLVSPFPPGSLLELADGRVGCVIAVNQKTLTRPVIEVWAASDGREVLPGTIIDLSRELLIGIAGSPDDKRLALPAVARRLPAARVWNA